MKPTDEELEAGAIEAERRFHWTGDPHYSKTAAMMRACKGRVRVKPLEWTQWGNEWDANSPIGTFTVKIDGHSGFYLFNPNGDKATEFWDDVQDRSTPDHCMAQAFKIVKSRILAALEPAPDHAEWDAAIEAAIVNLKTYAPHQDDTRSR